MIIGISGHQGAGKSTVCEVAINLGRPVKPFIRIGFSDPLYQMLLAMGLPEDIVFDKTRWNEPLDALCGQTTRYACDNLGDGWGRNTIGRDVWAKAGLRKAVSLERKGFVPILDNVRYVNEALAIMDAGGHVIAFNRNGLKPNLEKPSEREIPEIHREYALAAFTNSGDDLQKNSTEFRTLLDAIAGM